MIMMEVAGLTIAVFHEVYDLYMFINQVIDDARNQEKDLGDIAFKFTHQHSILHTFGTRFIKGRIIYKLDSTNLRQISELLQRLKNSAQLYQNLFTKYARSSGDDGGLTSDGPCRESLEFTEHSGKMAQETVYSSSQPEPLVKGGGGMVERLRKKMSKVQWALFDRQRLEAIVNEHKTWTDMLSEIIKWALLLYSAGDYGQARDLDEDARRLGFSSLTTRRMMILDPRLPSAALTLDCGEIVFSSSKRPARKEGSESAEPSYSCALVKGVKCLVEFKGYSSQHHHTDGDDIRERIQFLARLFSVENDQVSSPSPITSLPCLGYFHEPEKRRYGLAFQVPPGFSGRPLTLRSAIAKLESDERPTLGERFELAYAISYGLMEWHLIEWVHKGISGENIYIFRQHRQKRCDFSSPRIGGFEYSRPQFQGSVASDRVFRRGVRANIYRHPDRQGNTAKSHQVIHDLYSLGVLLLEIGLWMDATSPELFQEKKLKPAEMKENLVRQARSRLGHIMGTRYLGAVLFCLQAADEDQVKETSSKLSAAMFKETVVDVFEKARMQL